MGIKHVTFHKSKSTETAVYHGITPGTVRFMVRKRPVQEGIITYATFNDKIALIFIYNIQRFEAK
jgi:hypothetical protein